MVKEEVTDAAVLLYVLLTKLASAYISVLVESYHKVLAREECAYLFKILVEKFLRLGKKRTSRKVYRGIIKSAGGIVTALGDML
jgi:hypothetical protein